ncbi:MAG TPA: alpha-amlyase [Flavobacteriaceae bacterium]|nr:alpha-amlyase [Flavobacteriaceae bacterium]|tara:strand:+ start:42489 stop:43937 length:1449 start_codon:yes stop_codon:yes gene_type:complete
MKSKIAFLLLSTIVLISCKEEVKKEEPVEKTPQEITMAPIDHDVLESAVIYEANIRQYSTEGTFNAFAHDIPKLKELGVKIIWLMPIHPISEVKRKAKGDLLVADIENPEERKKYLGSPYAVADYTAVNPDMGTMEDFANMVDVAHENGIYVIIDWVPNHTGWDHLWITEHPEYYTKNDKGEITDPIQDNGEPWGWTDVADLNYDNKEMRQAMINEMLFWITEQKVDGFRCDVAHGVPLDFWEQCIPALREKKALFMLAEAELPYLMKGENLFDMSYAWEGHHVLNDIAKGKENVERFDRYMDSVASKFENDDILMNFVTNHDENAWAGPLSERMGDASEAMTALTYAIPGMPLIYSGQEYDMNYRLEFFGKDTIPKTKGKMWPLLEKLGNLKNNERALKGGKNSATYERIKTSKDTSVLAFKRSKEGNEFIYVANLSSKPVKFTLPVSGPFMDVMKDQIIDIVENEEHEFSPWQYLILRKQ